MCMHPDGSFNCIVNLIQIMGPEISWFSHFLKTGQRFGTPEV